MVDPTAGRSDQGSGGGDGAGAGAGAAARGGALLAPERAEHGAIPAEWIVAPGEFPHRHWEPIRRESLAAPREPDPARDGEPAVRRVAGWAPVPVDSEAVEQRPAVTPPVGASATGHATSPSLRHGAVAGLLPDVLARARIDPGRSGVRVVAVVAVVAAVVTGVVVWRGRPVPVPVAGPLAGPTVSAPAGEVVVAVSGKVRRPGLVRLRPGARVADAIAAAGGVLPGTSLGLLNLARKVVDGELIVVGAPAGIDPAGAAPSPGSGARLSLNAATVAQLDGLPGIGPVLAQRIVDFRTSRGGFRSVDQLREVDGVGESRYQRLKDLVTL